MTVLDKQAPHSNWIIEDQDDIPSSPVSGDNFFDVVERRINRRGFLKNITSLAATAALPVSIPSFASERKASGLSFTEIAHGQDDHVHVPEGYVADVLIRWGDPIFADSPVFDIQNLTAAAQEKQFGYNNDFVGFLPLPLNSTNSDHGLLAVNHEYTLPKLMHSGSPKNGALTQSQVDIDIAAHGMSIVEVKRSDNKWTVIRDSKYNRRITPKTPMQFYGAAAGNDRLKTAMFADGIATGGTFGNCAGGVTPWGTVLTGEENIQGYFLGDSQNAKEAENHKRFGLDGKARYIWGKYYDQWNIDKNPAAALHGGWIVEIDPYDPTSTPKKRTSLGRLKHEGCNVHINTDGRVVAYTGDDQRFEYVYKFVSEQKYNPDNRAANMDILDKGTLSVANFQDDGSLTWHPLTYGENSLDQSNGFHSQADIMLDARKAADIVGATQMDRPEDVEVNPVNGNVYIMLTNNSKRRVDQINAANPRAKNKSGQIIEMIPPNGDHAAETFTWEMLLIAGNPETEAGKYHDNISPNGWLADPDNCAFDNRGNLWIATDGAYKDGFADGVWVCPIDGDERALTQHFLRTPHQAELCGPCFTPDNKTFFCAVQHPGEKGTFDKPTTRWPDFNDNMPPRPSLLTVTKKDGGVIGS
jgi:secreted PhoX family phosphatase